MKKVSLLLFLAVVALVFGCKKDDAGTTCDTANMTYTANVKAIVDKNCALSGCHAAGATDGPMNDYISTVAFVTSKTKTTFLDAINWTGTAVKMPQGGAQLSDCDISKLEAWVNANFPL